MESFVKVSPLSAPGAAASGFTLLELMVSLLVIAVLVSGAAQASRHW